MSIYPRVGSYLLIGVTELQDPGASEANLLISVDQLQGEVLANLHMLPRKVDHPPIRTTVFVSRGMGLRFPFQLLCAAFALWFLIITFWDHDTFLPGIGYRTRGGSDAPATNSTLGFQKIFAISLPQRTDRQDALTLMSVLSGLEIDIAPGVRGEDVLEKTVPKVDDLIEPSFMRSMMDAYIMCTSTDASVSQK